MSNINSYIKDISSKKEFKLFKQARTFGEEMVFMMEELRKTIVKERNSTYIDTGCPLSFKTPPAPRDSMLRRFGDLTHKFPMKYFVPFDVRTEKVLNLMKKSDEDYSRDKINEVDFIVPMFSDDAYRVALGEDCYVEQDKLEFLFYYLWRTADEAVHLEEFLFPLNYEVRLVMLINIFKKIENKNNIWQKFENKNDWIVLLDKNSSAKMQILFYKYLKNNYSKSYMKVERKLKKLKGYRLLTVLKYYPEMGRELSESQKKYCRELIAKLPEEKQYKALFFKTFPEELSHVKSVKEILKTEEYKCLFPILIQERELDFCGVKAHYGYVDEKILNISPKVLSFIEDKENKLMTNNSEVIIQELFGRVSPSLKKIYGKYCLDKEGVNWGLIIFLNILINKLEASNDEILIIIENIEQRRKNGNINFNLRVLDDKLIEEFYVNFKELYPRKRIIKLLIELVVGKSHGFLTFKDTVYIHNQLKEKYYGKYTLLEKPKSITQLHDYLSKQFAKLERHSTKIALNQFQIRKLENKTFLKDKYTIRIPKTNWDLVDTGSELHHCVASYVGKVKSGISYIFNVYNNKNKNLLYTIEISSSTWTIKQAKGNFNRDVPREVLNHLKLILIKERPSVIIMLILNIVKISQEIISCIILFPFRTISSITKKMWISLKTNYSEFYSENKDINKE